MSLADVDCVEVRSVAPGRAGCQGAEVSSPRRSVPTEVSEGQTSQNRVDAEQGVRAGLRAAAGLCLLT